MSWRIRDGEGRLNWGLISFLALASACVAVWGALLAQYAVYRRWVGTGGVLAGCLFAGRVGCGWEGGAGHRNNRNRHRPTRPHIPSTGHGGPRCTANKSCAILNVAS